MGRKVLVVGGGGREHALAARLASSQSVSEVLVNPGNAGTSWEGSAASGLAPARNVAGDALDVAKAERPDLVVIGPEAPLCAGLVDELDALGVRAYGPSRVAAQLEGSKAFMKEFARRHGIPTAGFSVVRDAGAAEAYIESADGVPVVKADGLCAGKGVVVAATKAEAIEAASAMLDEGRFGDAGSTVVIEDRIDGAEASVHAICDGQRALVLPVAQDHKRIGDGDTGPNTGGMGAYGPAPLVDAALGKRVEEEIVRKVVDGMAAEGMPFRGTLFAGLMITPDGEPHLLEINVRFGDPETQVLMSLLDGDVAEAFDAAASGRLGRDSLRVRDEHALCIVAAAEGYPASPRKGDAITGIEEAEQVEGVRVYHAGTRGDGEAVLTSGGRVLGVTARGPSLAVAHERAYRGIELVRFEGMQFRRDIGARAL